MNFNLKKLIVGTLVMVTLLPSFAFADNSKGRSDDKKEQKSSMNFCSRISTLPTKTAEEITKAEERQSKNQSEKLSKIEGVGHIQSKVVMAEIKKAMSLPLTDELLNGKHKA